MKTINEQKEVKRTYVKPASKAIELDNTQMLAQSDQRNIRFSDRDDYYD